MHDVYLCRCWQLVQLKMKKCQNKIEVYMHPYTASLLVKTTSCHMFGDNILFQLILDYSLLDRNKLRWNLNTNTFTNIFEWNAFEHVACRPFCSGPEHYSDVIMGSMASQITGVSIICTTVCSGTDQRKHSISATLAFVWGDFTGDRWIPHTKGQ